MTNEVFVFLTPKAQEADFYKEIIKQLRLKFIIKAIWSRSIIDKEEVELLKKYCINITEEELNLLKGKKYICAILSPVKKDLQALDLIKEVVGSNNDPKRCMLGSIRREFSKTLVGSERLIEYTKTPEETAEQIAAWKPTFKKEKEEKS